MNKDWVDKAIRLTDLFGVFSIPCPSLREEAVVKVLQIISYQSAAEESDGQSQSLLGEAILDGAVLQMESKTRVVSAPLELV